MRSYEVIFSPMRAPHRKLLTAAAFILLPLILFQALRGSGTLDIYWHSPVRHFYIVTIVSVFSLLLAGAMGYTGMKLRNIGVSFLALAYISMTALIMLHGIATPGFIMEHNSVQGISSELGVLIASVWLALSGVTAARPLVLFLGRFHRWLVPAWTGVLVLCFFFAMNHPHILAGWSERESTRTVSTAIVLILLASAARSYWKGYKAARMPLQLSIVYSCGWLGVGQLIMVLGEPWRLSWWLYHVLLLMSLLAVAAGILLQYASSHSLLDSMRALFRSDPKEWLQKCISPSVQALIQATEEKDGYTAGHNYRVALYALKLAERMGLASSDLMAIGQGGIIHDVGKLQIPQSILNKPDVLTQEERSVVELHPVHGYELCRKLGFMQEELAVIRSHHERWDGTGYPDQLREKEIPLLARITAVADVYDALTSSRSYRKAMTHQQALGIISAQRGRQFDPACVDAWLSLAEEEPGFFAATATDMHVVPPRTLTV